MKWNPVWGSTLLIVLAATVALAEDWTGFRGKNSTATSNEKNLPVKWSETENIAWRTKMPGPGTSSPIILGDKIYLTSYSGYGVEGQEGSMKELTFHVLCVDRKSGNILWEKKIKPSLPESNYSGFMLLHGYTSSTPATDGKNLYVFLGKTGVFCFDLNGNEVWRESVGTEKHSWGSGTSPVLYKDLVIINASVESGKLVALNKTTGKEVWSAPDISESWSTPVLVKLAGGKTELVVSGSHKVMGFDPDKGEKLWHANTFTWYVCPTLLPHDGVVYALQNSTCAAIKCGGKGDVTKSHTLWQKNFGSTVSSFVYQDGHVFFANNNGKIYCLKADSGDVVYSKNLTPEAGTVYASPIVAEGKIYFVSQKNGTFVLAASPKFEQLAHNVFKDDNSRTNASPIVDQGCIILRTDKYLYCIGKKS